MQCRVEEKRREESRDRNVKIEEDRLRKKSRGIHYPLHGIAKRDGAATSHKISRLFRKIDV